MNCKHGDLAIVVRSMAGNEGKIVRCLRFAGKAIDSAGFKANHGRSDNWEIDRELVTSIGTTCKYAPDAWLRPIRGDLLDNETERETEAV